MAFYVFLLIGILLGLTYLILTQPAQKSAALLVNGGPLILIVIGVLLTATRRGVIGLPLIFIGVTWLRRIRARSPISSTGGRTSKVRSSKLEMELNHDTGELDGRVLTGRMEGRKLSSLSEDELLDFYLDIQADSESVALLESYLERYHPGWHSCSRPHKSHDKRRTGRGDVQEMCSVFPGRTWQPFVAR